MLQRHGPCRAAQFERLPRIHHLNLSKGATSSEQTSVLITGGNERLGLETARPLGNEAGRTFSACAMKVEDRQGSRANDPRGTQHHE
jgi:hypothetical protein